MNGASENTCCASRSVPANPIAICGMALRLPSGVNTPQKLWDFLVAKRDARGLVPASRYNASSFYDATGKPATIKTQHGYFLDEDIASLDTSFFTMTRTEVERADPQQRLLLEVARECLEDACETEWRGKTIGTFIGNLNEDWCEMFAKDNQQWGTQRLTGIGDFALSNRVSYEMDLRGPSMTLRTACSASLVALHQACAAIARGDCISAIVGGTNLMMAPNTTMSMSEQGVLSPDGSCNTFSADANGYARGEAITAVYLKPLDNAIRDGNPIRAIIRGTATNHDGKTPGMTFPSAKSQEAMMRRAYRNAGIPDLEIERTGYVECHGTGTQAGDPVETSAVARVFGTASPTVITSIKPNFGHTEGSSGLLSIMKAVLSLQHRTIPPNIKFGTPNPSIPFETSNLIVPTEPMPWPEDRLDRVSVNSFGIGGTNAHAIIESATSLGVMGDSPMLSPTKTSSMVSDSPQLLVYSANSSKSLTRMIENYSNLLSTSETIAEDVAFTLANGREHLPYRSFAIANRNSVSAASPVVKIGQSSNIIMVFTGQGAQWPQMGRELLLENAAFLATIRQLDEHLATLGEHAPRWSIEGELSKAPKRGRAKPITAELSQPLCTAVQIALVDALAEIGIKPQAVVGHSSGEIAAAYASHALTKEEAIIASLYRGIATVAQKRKGAMAAIGMSAEQVKKYLIPNTALACDNSHASVTISGDTTSIEEVIASISIAEPDVLARKLQVDKAYHSYHMDEIAEDYLALMQPHIFGGKPTIPFFSSLTGQLWDNHSSLDPTYWQKNLQKPVLFRSTVDTLLQAPVATNAVFVEVGPHSTLAGPLRQISSQRSITVPYVPTMIRGANCISSFLSAAGRLYTIGVPIDFRKLIPSGQFIPDLPRYPWNHEQSYWYESRLSKDHRFRAHSYHDLLGARIVESTDMNPSWRNLLHLENAPWIRDHKVEGDIVFPFAGYIAVAGEAIRQLTGIEETIRVRRVVVKTALVVAEGKPTEIITTCHPHRLTDTTNSQWWEFTIAAHNGHTWTNHCTGQVMAQTDSLGALEDTTTYSRKVEARQWLDTLRRNGLDLGPGFRNFQNVTASPSSHKANGTLLNKKHPDASRYHIHPATVDSALQLLAVASAHGMPRKHRTWLPTVCEELSMTKCNVDITVDASTHLAGTSALIGNATGVVNGAVVIKFQGLKLSPLERADATNDLGAARCIWAPDLDFLDVQDLVDPSVDHAQWLPYIEELGRLCILHSHFTLVDIPTVDVKFEEFLQWIQHQTTLLDAHPLRNAGLLAISEAIRQFVKSVADSPAAATAEALQSVCFRMKSILSDATCSKDIIEPDKWNNILSFVHDNDISPFIRGLAHSIPNLRVVEIGSWSDSASPDVLDALKLPDGSVLCSKYIFTSKGYISSKERGRQAQFPNLKHVTLDIGGDLAEQEFEDEGFDLIIAHSTITKMEELANIKRLLHSQGRLLVQELDHNIAWIKYLLNAQETSGSSKESGLPSRDNGLQSLLTTSGFENISSLPLKDSPSLLYLARPNECSSPATRITLLQDERADSLQVIRQLESEGYAVDLCTLESIPPTGQDVLSLLDMQGPFFENIESVTFERFQAFLRQLKEAGIFWVTRPSQLNSTDPRYAQIIGAARTIRSEMLIDFATCEVEDLDNDFATALQVFQKFQARCNADTLAPDFEYIIRNGIPHVGRFHPLSLRDELLVENPDDPLRLDIGTPGRLNTLDWVLDKYQTYIGPEDVEVEMHSVGVNFRDILVAMRLIETGSRVFGYEGAGIIRRVGSNVTSLAVGDRVAVVQHNTFATSLVTPALFCVRIPGTLTFEQASTMFIPYMTALHSLITVGGLREGQSVLIHSACGGVGIAAVRVAQMLNAEVYATVGSDEKVQFLIDNLGLPKNRIFNSRDISFAEDIKRETNGRGIDVVLNSLGGDLLHATWHCVAPFGKLVEIGKRDLLGCGKLDMSPFLANRSYCCVDLDGYGDQPEFFNRLLCWVLELYKKGSISPVEPIKTFDAGSVYDAFRYMQPGQHIGRICVSLRNCSEALNISRESKSRQRSLELDTSASYLLVGGLGGLGRSVSSWLVEHGARHLIFLSRNAGLSPDDAAFSAELNDMGCQTELVRGSVLNLEDVQRALQSTTRPVKGVLQMSMVLRDENFATMSMQQWNEAVAPKVQGTWNLHKATLDLDLDFFVMLSSLSGVVGQLGQANYASANTFLDAFVQMRNEAGLAASAIDLGAVGEVGFLSEDSRLLQEMTSRGFEALKEQDVLDAMAVAISSGSTKREVERPNSYLVDNNNFVVGMSTSTPLSSPNSRAVWRRDRRMGVYHNIQDTSKGDVSSSVDLKAYIAGAKKDISVLKSADSGLFLAKEIGKRLFLLLLKPEDDVNISLSLQDLGMDSLVGIELRTWWKQVFGFDTSVLEMLGMGTLEALGKHAAEGLLGAIAQQE